MTIEYNTFLSNSIKNCFSQHAENDFSLAMIKTDLENGIIEIKTEIVSNEPLLKYQQDQKKFLVLFFYIYSMNLLYAYTKYQYKPNEVVIISFSFLIILRFNHFY